MMNNNFYGGSIRMIPDVKNKKTIPVSDEDFDSMFDEGYPYRIPKVYLEGWMDPYESLDLGEDSVVIVRDKHIVKYTKIGYKEFLAETETGESIWIDSREEGCFKGRYLGDSRIAYEYAVEEYNIETSKKRKYKVVFEEESEMDSMGYYLLSHSVDGETLGNHFEIVDGVLFRCFSDEESIVIPEGVTDIARDAFKLCRHFKSIVIPSTVTNIPYGFCCIDRIEVARDNPKYYIQNGCLIDKEEKELVWAFSGSAIPDDGSVVKIGSNAFCHRYDLSKIVIPDAINEIEDNAFSSCGCLEEIILPVAFVDDAKRIFGRELKKDGNKWTLALRNFSGFCF